MHAIYSASAIRPNAAAGAILNVRGFIVSECSVTSGVNCCGIILAPHFFLAKPLRCVKQLSSLLSVTTHVRMDQAVLGTCVAIKRPQRSPRTSHAIFELTIDLGKSCFTSVCVFHYYIYRCIKMMLRLHRFARNCRTMFFLFIKKMHSHNILLTTAV